MMSVTFAKITKLANSGLISFKQGHKIFSSAIISSKKDTTSENNGDDLFGVLKDRADLNEKLWNRMQQDGFKLFGLKRQYQLDPQELKKEMRRLQNILHPDRFIEKDPETQRRSHNLSSLVNSFYETLSNPYERGKHLLSLSTQKDIYETERSLEQLKLDDDFLARMMETREIIQDPQSDRNSVSALQEKLVSEMESILKELDYDFSKGDNENIRRKLARLKFLTNCYIASVDRLVDYGNY